MKLYTEMLNIERAIDRKALMLKELENKNIKAHIFKGIDFKEVKKEEILAEFLPYGPWGQLDIQSMACTLSHAKAWERFLRSDAEICFIMEDDVHVSEDLEQWLINLSWWPDGADIVKLECWVEKINKKGSILFENPGKCYLNRKVKRLLTRHMGGAGYLLTRKAAKKLLKSKPFDMAVDHILFNINASKIAKKMNIYQIIPALIIQGNEPKKQVNYTGNRQNKRNASGFSLLRQEYRRGLYEISVPFKTLLKFLNGKAAFEKITYENSTKNKS